MKRKLTKTEKDLCKKGIKNREKRLADYKNELAYLEDYEEFNSKWAKYLEDKAKKEKANKQKIVDQTLSYLKEQIEHETTAILNETEQLKNGVEVKEAVGVN